MDLWRHATKQVLTPSTSGVSGRWPCAAGERREKVEALWQELGAVDLGADPEPRQHQLGTARHAGVAPRRCIQWRRDVLVYGADLKVHFRNLKMVYV